MNNPVFSTPWEQYTCTNTDWSLVRSPVHRNHQCLTPWSRLLAALPQTFRIVCHHQLAGNFAASQLSLPTAISLPGCYVSRLLLECSITGRTCQKHQSGENGFGELQQTSSHSLSYHFLSNYSYFTLMYFHLTITHYVSWHIPFINNSAI